MPAYPFLSDEWLEEARKIRAEYEGKTPPIPHQVRMNLVVTAVPFSDDDIHAHMDTSSGELILEIGHLEIQDLKVTVDYDTAKAILIEGNPQAGMQAFMAGKVQGRGRHGQAHGAAGRAEQRGHERRRDGHPVARHHRVTAPLVSDPGQRPTGPPFTWRRPPSPAPACASPAPVVAWPG